MKSTIIIAALTAALSGVTATAFAGEWSVGIANHTNKTLYIYTTNDKAIWQKTNTNVQSVKPNENAGLTYVKAYDGLLTVSLSPKFPSMVPVRFGNNGMGPAGQCYSSLRNAQDGGVAIKQGQYLQVVSSSKSSNSLVCSALGT